MAHLLKNIHWIDRDREIVTSSVTNIPKRLMEIDKGYFVVRNHKTGRFEIHHTDGFPLESFQLTLPFDELDERTLQYVWDTRVENSKAIFELMERQNAKLEEDEQKKSDEITQELAKDIYQYCNNNHPSKDTIDDGAYTTRFL
jgi:hypothetical protein